MVIRWRTFGKLVICLFIFSFIFLVLPVFYPKVNINTLFKPTESYWMNYATVKAINKISGLTLTEVAVVVVTCNRLSFTKSLESLHNANNYEIYPFDYYVSNDCNNKAVAREAQKYSRFTYLALTDNPNITDGYTRICHHYRKFLSEIFDIRGYDKVIVVEDDLDTSIDFLDYFSNMKIMLDNDPSVLCISAWNDNGYQSYAHNPYRFHRTEFFPGLGWMINHKLWDEIKYDWPKSYWDEYFRDPKISKKRTCVYPEVSRVENFGKKGQGTNGFFVQYVEPVKKNKELIDYNHVDIEALQEKNYADWFLGLFEKAVEVDILTYEKIKHDSLNHTYKIAFGNRDDYYTVCKNFGITSATRYHIPRSSFHKITYLNLKSHLVFLYPTDNFIELDS